MKKKSNISVIYIILQALLLAASLFFFICYMTDWLSNFMDVRYNFLCCFRMFILTFAPYALLIFKVKTTTAAQVYYFFALAGHFIGGNLLNLYATSAIYNSILHFVNTGMIGVIIYSLLAKQITPEKKLTIFLATVACSIAVGVLWEIYEFLFDVINDGNMQRFKNSITGEPFIGQRALLDTMLDFFMDIAGGVFGALCAYLVKIKGLCLYKYFDFVKIDSHQHVAIEKDSKDEMEVLAQDIDDEESKNKHT